MVKLLSFTAIRDPFREPASHPSMYILVLSVAQQKEKFIAYECDVYIHKKICLIYSFKYEHTDILNFWTIRFFKN